jgi:hypothetical protein
MHKKLVNSLKFSLHLTATPNFTPNYPQLNLSESQSTTAPLILSDTLKISSFYLFKLRDEEQGFLKLRKCSEIFVASKTKISSNFEFILYRIIFKK